MYGDARRGASRTSFQRFITRPGFRCVDYTDSHSWGCIRCRPDRRDRVCEDISGSQCERFMMPIRDHDPQIPHAHNNNVSRHGQCSCKMQRFNRSPDCQNGNAGSDKRGIDFNGAWTGGKLDHDGCRQQPYSSSLGQNNQRKNIDPSLLCVPSFQQMGGSDSNCLQTKVVVEPLSPGVTFGISQPDGAGSTRLLPNSRSQPSQRQPMSEVKSQISFIQNPPVGESATELSAVEDVEESPERPTTSDLDWGDMMNFDTSNESFDNKELDFWSRAPEIPTVRDGFHPIQNKERSTTDRMDTEFVPSRDPQADDYPEFDAALPAWPLSTEYEDLCLGPPTRLPTPPYDFLTPDLASQIEEISPAPITHRTTRTSQRDHKKDEFLIRCKKQGMSYRTIKELGHFEEAESTLRGRYRTLTKPKEQRLRRPEWPDHEVSRRPN